MTAVDSGVAGREAEKQRLISVYTTAAGAVIATDHIEDGVEASGRSVPEALTAFARELRADQWDRAAPPQRREFDIEDCLDALQAVGTPDEFQVLTMPEYERRRAPDHPSASTITSRLGSWESAKAFAGLGVQR